MSLINPEEHQPPEPPRGHVRMVYLGPVAPHWEVESEFGDRAIIEEFRQPRPRRAWCSCHRTIRSSAGTVSGSSATPSARTSSWNGISVCPKKRSASPDLRPTPVVVHITCRGARSEV